MSTFLDMQVTISASC